MSSEASPDTRLHESNRLAHEVADAYLRQLEAYRELAACEPGSVRRRDAAKIARLADSYLWCKTHNYRRFVNQSSESQSGADETIDTVEQELYSATTAYERFVSGAE